jgi:hypothetical protein
MVRRYISGAELLHPVKGEPSLYHHDTKNGMFVEHNGSFQVMK